jgi:6-phosphogluconolactonase
MNSRDVVICRDAADLNKRAAEEFIRLAGQAVQSAGRFTVVLSGGSTPRGLYELLALDAYKERVPWSKVHLFWGDERCVAPDHPDSNYRMAREALLARISIPVENVHRMVGEQEPAVAATEYEDELKKFFRVPDGVLPRFDLILLGLGEDGHTASLFPGSAALAESGRVVVAHYVEKLRTHRLTLTLPVLNHGAELVFLVSGDNKAEMVKQILAGDRKPPPLPAARVRPSSGRLIWMVTQDAAALLPEAGGTND